MLFLKKSFAASLKSNAAAFKGSIMEFLTAPAIPPCRSPFSSSLPRIRSLNLFVVEAKPTPAPSTILPTKPNGPSIIPATAPIPILGAAFLIRFTVPGLIIPLSSLLPSSSSLPNIFSMKALLFLAYATALPIINPPMGPKGVIKPVMAPAIP